MELHVSPGKVSLGWTEYFSYLEFSGTGLENRRKCNDRIHKQVRIVNLIHK